MKSMCDRVHEFADGELSPAETEAFQEHLRDCEGCGRELENIFALKGLAETSLPSSPAPATRELRQVRPLRARRTWLLGGVAGLAVAAAAAFPLIPRLTSSPVDRPWLTANENRAIEPRLGDPRADRYGRHEQMRGGAEAGHTPDYVILGELEKRGDRKGMINRYLFVGDAVHAGKMLAEPASAIGFENERAALALLEHQATQALTWTTAALAHDPRAPQPLWNRALALRDLKAELGAAAVFDQVAALSEPGWSEEARVQAAQLRRNADERQQRWDEARHAAERLVATGARPPDEVVARFPDLVRDRLYHALWTARSRAELDRLEPTAGALDAHYREPGVLVGALGRVQRLDLRRRAPLAATFAALSNAGWRPAAAVSDYVTTLRKAGPVGRDLLLGVLLDAAASAPPGELDRLAAEQGDPWFEAAVVEATLGAGAIGDERAREARLARAADEARRHNLEGAALRLDIYRAYLLFGQKRDDAASKLIEHALAASTFPAFETPRLLERARGYRDEVEILKAYRDEVVAAH
jgi:hypothetical protein